MSDDNCDKNDVTTLEDCPRSASTFSITHETSSRLLCPRIELLHRTKVFLCERLRVNEANKFRWRRQKRKGSVAVLEHTKDLVERGQRDELGWKRVREEDGRDRRRREGRGEEATRRGGSGSE